ncbi:hypothetical protein B7P43_G08656 [Cryptotermes secundus]|uniref:Uncharacterized protein n=1 Tax=Cryptotermes secundus TaxID=105785 RepID=A0A2J7PUH4_9NEOP|nr:hypothetical protein B7P43_G08656 [Cryptotermes secundus]
MLMMVAANRSRPLVRPKREIHPNQEMDIDALPGLGVYWDTNILIRQKGEPGANGSTLEQKMKTTRPASQVDGQATSNITPDHEAEIPADYGDHQDRTLVSKGLLPQSNERLETGDDLTARANSFLHELHTSEKESRQQEDASLGNEGYSTGGTELTRSPNPSYTKYHHYDEFRPVWDYYQDDGYDSTPSAVSSLEVGLGNEGSVSDYELNLYPFMNFANYVWSIVASASKRILSSVTVAQCYELVVCEAHRVGRAWGESGMLLASGLR